jgi:GTP pyrophosphokinase
MQVTEKKAVYSAEDKRLIRNAYRRLVRSFKPTISESDKKLIHKAFKIAAEAHVKQRRKSGIPYIIHPIEVAKIVHEEIGLGKTGIICALLHDTVEDTDMTHQDVLRHFGPKIAKIVDGLTKLDGLYNVESPQAENFKKVLSTLVEDVRVVLIKMADRLHNLRTIGPMPRHKQLKIAAETSFIYAPLAHRLGLYNVRLEFNDICLRITEPDAYEEISEQLRNTEKERKKYINDIIRPLKNRLASLNIKYRIVGRPKSISSVYNKIRTKRVSFDEIYDLFAIRVIVDTPVDQEKTVCWQIYSVITDVYKPIPERLKDWVTTPKSNGYESLHTTVIGPGGKYVEVQIRSERMDDIAERGLAAHWKYKGLNQSNAFETWFDSIRDILETPHSDAVEFINDFKANLFKEEVYVYTPKGDMRILPKGATALDFAFDIHTDVGYHATAIKVNNKLVPMGYRLRSGDQLEVITGKNQKPNKGWLKMVVTGKARSKIRSAMKEEKRKRGELGKEDLVRKLKNLKLDFEDNVDFLVKHLGYGSRPDLYYDIAIEKINLTETLRSFDVENGRFVEHKTQVLQPTEPVEKKKQRSASSKLMINGELAENMDYSFAKCCNPVQGDDIFAYLSATQGLKIHRTNCPNATHIMANYGYRIMKAEWAEESSTNFVVDLHIIGIDDGPGVIQRLTNEISNRLGLNIRSFSIAGEGGYFEGRVSLMVINKDQLNLAIQTISKLDGITSVVREEKVNQKRK